MRSMLRLSCTPWAAMEFIHLTVCGHMGMGKIARLHEHMCKDVQRRWLIQAHGEEGGGGGGGGERILQFPTRDTTLPSTLSHISFHRFTGTPSDRPHSRTRGHRKAAGQDWLACYWSLTPSQPDLLSQANRPR